MFHPERKNTSQKDINKIVFSHLKIKSKVIFLAAGKSKRIFNKIGKNKCLLEIKKKTLIERSIEEINKTKIKDITIVLGFKQKLIKSLKKLT